MTPGDEGRKAYLQAADDAFGGEIDYAMIHKLYGSPQGEGSERRYSPTECVDTSAMQAGISDHVWSLEEIAKLAD